MIMAKRNMQFISVANSANSANRISPGSGAPCPRNSAALCIGIVRCRPVLGSQDCQSLGYASIVRCIILQASYVIKKYLQIGGGIGPSERALKFLYPPQKIFYFL